MTATQSQRKATTIVSVSRKCRFGQLQVGDTFFYQEQVYRKESELSAILVRWVRNAEKLPEVISHRFFPEILVEAANDGEV